MAQSYKNKKDIAIESRLDSVDSLLTWVETCWSDSSPPNQDGWPLLKAQALTGIVELFTNSVRHAHRDLDPAPPIVLIWTSDRQGFSICIHDHGQPFAPEQMFGDLRLMTAQGGADPNERDLHWGLLILLRLCDDHGWLLRTIRSATGINTVTLEHAWPSLPNHTESLRLPSTR